MRCRTALITGSAIGYVLGAKAGRTRYEQIRQVWLRASRLANTRSSPDLTVESVVREPFAEPFADPRYTPGT